ncbi:hypothetical protein [Sphaerimonospora mesophila]|uniref:hypothetical protein n=1 Tax=Sphaerimonospora mesophila TaxID=37483 RepID=UPI001F302464
MRSDAGRLWASRVRPFPAAAERAGACRTVDADDLRELGLAIAQQESIAEQAAQVLENGTAQGDATGRVTEQVRAARSAVTA